MARQTAGLVLPGGLTVPAAPLIYLGADDEWNFDQTGGCSQTSSPHAGIELDCMLAQRMAIRRIHYPFANGPSGSPARFPWPNVNQTNFAALRNPRTVPMITHGSQGGGSTGFPVKTSGNGYTNTTPWRAPNGTSYTGIDIITNGKFDAAYTAAFASIAAIPGPVIFNLYQEMNIPAMGAYGGYQGGATGAGAAAYIACYRHLHALADAAGATNMIWTWAPSFDNNAINYNPQATGYYPGDTYVDIIMLDLYRHYFAGNVDFLYNFAFAHGKPFGIAESGYSETATSNTPNVSKSTMVSELLSSMKLPKYQETAFFIHWNGSGVRVDWDDHIDTSPASLAAYQTFAADSAFNVYFGGGSNTSQAPLNSVPPALNDTTPASVEAISVVDGQWQGVPAPTLTSAVQGAPNTVAAKLAPVAAYGMSDF